MIDYEIRIKELESKVHDLQWRMNQVCNQLSMEEEEAKPESKKSILECRWCGSHESCRHGQVVIGSRSIDPKNPCARPDDTDREAQLGESAMKSCGTESFHKNTGLGGSILAEQYESVLKEVTND